jgi:hypothetical protein
MALPQGITFINDMFCEHCCDVLVIQVRWDEASSIPRPERVSPWQIEPAVSPPPVNPLPVHRPKRPRSNAVASLAESSAPTKEGLALSCVQKLVLHSKLYISCSAFFRYT